jgi:hypothetical protein
MVFLLTIANSQHTNALDRTVDTVNARETGLLGSAGDLSVSGSRRGQAVAVGREHRTIADLVVDPHMPPASRVRWLRRRRDLLDKLQNANGGALWASKPNLREASVRRAEAITARIAVVEERLDGGRARVYRSQDASDVVERIDYEVNSIGRQIHAAYLVIGAMASLAAVGAVYAHWHVTGPFEVEMWVIATFLLAALIYAATISNTLRSARRHAGSAIRALPLTSLFELQHCVPPDEIIRYGTKEWAEVGQRDKIIDRWKQLVLGGPPREC